jgi:hypothetical protein
LVGFFVVLDHGVFGHQGSKWRTSSSPFALDPMNPPEHGLFRDFYLSLLRFLIYIVLTTHSL